MAASVETDPVGIRAVLQAPELYPAALETRIKEAFPTPSAV
jgi:hypothetical protein